MPNPATRSPQKEHKFIDVDRRIELGQLLLSPGPVVRVAIGSLRVAGTPRSAGESPEHVKALADMQDELPPIIVHRPTMRVIDGLHRLRAAMLRDQRDIAARFFDGSEADAFVLAVRANVTHGLPLSLSDRKAAAKDILKSHPQWSDRLIASVTGLSPKTIAEVRRRGAGTRPHPDGGAHSAGRIGQDGRVRPGDSKERRRIASKLMQDDPNLSLRQVASSAGISPETARAVRARLLRGEDPEPPASRSPEVARRGPKRMVEQPDWSSVVQRLRTDPALRFSETGRILLRLLDLHTVSAEKWASMVDGVPPHCRPTIAGMAWECARRWNAFAEELERQPPGIDGRVNGASGHRGG